MGEDSGEFRAALESRLPSTCTIRSRSAITQGDHLGRLGRDRQRSGLDAGHVQQVADQQVHLAHLSDDDAEELARLVGVQGSGRFQQGGD